MEKKVLKFIVVFLTISAILFFASFYGKTTGNVIGISLKTPVITGDVIEGILILDVNDMPLDSVVEVSLGEQDVQKPVSSFIDKSSFSIGNVKINPEVVLTLKPVPRTTDAGSFKAEKDNALIGNGGNDEIIDLPEEPDNGNNINGGNKLNGSSGIIGNVVLGGDNFKAILNSNNGLTLNLNGGDFQLVEAKSGNNSVPFDKINGVYYQDKLVVTTDYSINIDGFVKKGNTLLDIDLKKFGIIAREGILKVNVLYDGNILTGESRRIKSIGGFTKGNYLISDEIRSIKKDIGEKCDASNIKVDRCVVNPLSSNAFKDEINEGRVTKITYTDCTDEIVKVIECSDKTKIRIEDISDNGEKKLDIKDVKNDNLVAKVIYNKVGNTLDIAFSQFSKEEKDNCNNGILDDGESGIDCGGKCNECIYQKKSNFWIFWILFGFVFIFSIWRSSISEGIVARRLIRRGKKAIQKEDFVSAVENYNDLKNLSLSFSNDELRKFKKKSSDYYLSLKRELSKRGVNVVDDKEKKGLPRLLYGKKSFKFGGVKVSRGAYDDLSRVKELVRVGIKKLKFGKKKIAISNYNLVKGIYSNLDSKDKNKIMNICLKLYLLLKDEKSLLLKRKIRKEIIKTGKLPKI